MPVNPVILPAGCIASDDESSAVPCALKYCAYVKTGFQSAYQRFLIRQRLPASVTATRRRRPRVSMSSSRCGAAVNRFVTVPVPGRPAASCGELKRPHSSSSMPTLGTALPYMHHVPAARRICEPPMHHRVAAIAGLAGTAALGGARLHRGRERIRARIQARAGPLVIAAVSRMARRHVLAHPWCPLKHPLSPDGHRETASIDDETNPCR